MNLATVVIDNGTGYTKMGYAGNMEPSYLIPTVLADSRTKGSTKVANQTKFENPELDFYIGDEAYAHQKSHDVQNIIRSG
jgi:actin-related protein 3